MATTIIHASSRKRGSRTTADTPYYNKRFVRRSSKGCDEGHRGTLSLFIETLLAILFTLGPHLTVLFASLISGLSARFKPFTMPTGPSGRTRRFTRGNNDVFLVLDPERFTFGDDRAASFPAARR